MKKIVFAINFVFDEHSNEINRPVVNMICMLMKVKPFYIVNACSAT